MPSDPQIDRLLKAREEIEAELRRACATVRSRTLLSESGRPRPLNVYLSPCKINDMATNGMAD